MNLFKKGKKGGALRVLMVKGALNAKSHKFIMEITRVIASALVKMAFRCGHGFSD